MPKVTAVRRLTPEALVGAAGRSDIAAKNTWLEKSPNTQYHCAFASFLIAAQYISEAKRNHEGATSTLLSKHVKDEAIAFKKWAQQQNISIPDTFADETTLKHYEKKIYHCLQQYIRQAVGV